MNTSTCLVFAAGLLVASEAQARNPNPGIVPPDHSVHGLTYAQWSSEWVQWALGIPSDMHPVTDTTGEFADVHQSGAVWFLVPSLEETLTRTVTVPSDKFLFVPIPVGSTWVALGPPGSHVPLKVRRHILESEMDSMISEYTFWCEIDGVAVSDLASYAIITAPGESYFVRLPDDNIYGVPAGRYGPSINAGIFLMLRPLSAGEHTIQFFGSDNETFTTDVTYNLTVEP